VKGLTPPSPLIIRFTEQDCICTSYSEENFGGNQLLDSSISLSPLYPNLTIDLTSEPLRSSTSVSTGFNLSGYSSLSFGSQQLCYNSVPSDEASGPAGNNRGSSLLLLTYYVYFAHRSAILYTRISVELLGPCYKTGRLASL